jgi:hypothetical protein
MNNFTNFYYESVVASSRKGIPHLYEPTGNYSLSPKDFLNIIDFIKKSNEGKLNSVIAHWQEKMDGFHLSFGINSDNKFFIESSHSNPIYDSGKFRQFTVDKKGESDPISEAFEDILVELKDNKKLQSYLKSINTPNGIKIQTECFYMPLGKSNPEDNSVVKFVATWYKKEKLGNWATFVVLNVTDGKGNPLHHDKVNEIKDGFKKLSTNTIKFDDSDVPEFDEVDLSKEIEMVKKFVGDIEKEYGEKIDSILNDSSRKKGVLERKRRIKEEILKFQKEFSNKLSKLIKNGKFGEETEGIVIDLANGVLMKVTTDRFKEAKKQYNKEYK